MRTGHPSEAILNEWAEGGLSEFERAAVARHLEGCAPCRAEGERLAGLIADLAALPREVLPPRDLLPGIRRRIDAAGSAGSPGGRRGSMTGRRLALAASVTLVVVTAAATALIVRQKEAAPVAGRDRPAATAPGPAAELRAVTAEYDRAVEALAAELEARRGELDPATVRIVEENLALVDRAIREARAALAADPADDVLQRLVVASYEQKIDLLRRAARTEPAAL